MAPPSGLNGGLHWVQPHRVSGWAFAPLRPQDHVRVEVRLDGVLIATGEASLRLDALVQNAALPGDHGFLVNTEVTLPVDALERIAVEAVGFGGERLRLLLPVPKRRRREREGVRFTAADPRQHPVFVLGSVRSGTSVMGRALRKTGRYAGHGEGHLMTLLPELLETAAAHYRRDGRHAAEGQFTLLAGVAPQVIEDGLRAMFAAITRAEFPGGWWMDKTPGAAMIRAAPVLREVWPGARFIFMKRRGVDNIESRRRKFDGVPFEDHCRDWSATMLAWDAVRAELAAVSVEIEQMEMALHPGAVVEQIAVLLPLSAAEAGRMLHALTTDRPQQTADSFAELADIEAIGWDTGQRDMFAALCGEAMRRFGYIL